MLSRQWLQVLAGSPSVTSLTPYRQVLASGSIGTDPFAYTVCQSLLYQISVYDIYVYFIDV